jgi:hypothetical protein
MGAEAIAEFFNDVLSHGWGVMIKIMLQILFRF